MKAPDHGGEEHFRIKTFKIKRMTGLQRQDGEKHKLRPPIAFTKRMNGVEIGKEMR